jgi:hypothetical protein
MLKYKNMNKYNKILLIEDDKKKIDDVKNFFSIYFCDCKLIIKESYQSGLKELIYSDYDLLLLDMSIPTWDKSPIEPGGNFEKFGGYKILKEIVRKGKSIDTILITMFDDFGESDTSITLSQIDKALTEEFQNIYKGYVFYSSKESNWQDELSLLINKGC